MTREPLLPPSPVKNRRLLVVDDEPSIRLGCRDALSPAPHPGPGGFDIVEAESGDQALEILLRELAAGHPFAGAIVDVRMPGRLDGLEFVREAWKADPGLQVVVATAYQERTVDEIDQLFGAQFQDQWDYLNKPFSAGELIQKARHIVSSWNRREQERAYLARIQEQQEAMISQEKLAAMGRLARNVGHEFGNVLQPLLTKLETARMGAAPAQHALFDEMIETAEFGSLICQDLLTFAKDDHETSAAADLPLRRPVERALRILSHCLKRRDASVTLQLPEDLMVRAHEPKLVQVFINLLTNALDAVADGGEIRIEGRADGPLATLTVSDNGAGIPEYVLPMVFQPLFTTKGLHGNGIGLAICKQIVEGYSGAIRVESEVRRGTRVTLQLPRT